MFKSRILLWLLSGILVFSLVGCGSTQKAPEFNPEYYPQCYDPIAKLCKDQDNSDEIKGAATGALLGAASGAVIGGIATGNWRGAAVGAAGGAVAGGAAGFFIVRLDKIQNRDQRLAEYQKLLGEQSANWDLERASVEKAYKCYAEQINLLKQAYKDKKISKEDLLVRMNEIKAGLQNINTYWAQSQTRMDERLADADAFLAKQEQEDMKLKAAEQKKAQQQLAKLRARNESTNKQRKEQDAKTTQFGESTLADLESFMEVTRSVDKA